MYIYIINIGRRCIDGKKMIDTAHLYLSCLASKTYLTRYIGREIHAQTNRQIDRYLDGWTEWMDTLGMNRWMDGRFRSISLHLCCSSPPDHLEMYIYLSIYLSNHLLSIYLSIFYMVRFWTIQICTIPLKPYIYFVFYSISFYLSITIYLIIIIHITGKFIINFNHFSQLNLFTYILSILFLLRNA